MSELKTDTQEQATLKVALPEGSFEASGSPDFIDRVRVAFARVLAGGALSEQRPYSPEESASSEPPTPTVASPARQPSIRDLYTEKRPTTDTQTAALIAYYLGELAPPSERQDSIDTKTTVDYFKKCPRQLPGNTGSILPHAKRDGYLDPSGDHGKYKLSTIGYNLVVHGLPASASTPQPVRSKKAKARPKNITKKRG